VSSRHPPKPPARGTRGAVACGHPLGSAAALEVFMAGGNAVDAAVAAGAALGVVLPEACGLGGDALALVRPGDGGPVVAFNGWGAAPRAVPERIPHDGGGTVPPPGVVRAWADMLAEAGTRELGAVLAPAIRLAEDGVPPGAPLLARATRSAAASSAPPGASGSWTRPCDRARAGASPSWRGRCGPSRAAGPTPSTPGTSPRRSPARRRPTAAASLPRISRATARSCGRRSPGATAPSA
jgi:gamma-glutamyltranspeptidase